MKRQIKDSTGTLISPLSIVRTINEIHIWSEFQGIVVEPDSSIEGPDYCTAVYFFREAEHHEFSHRQLREEIPIREWDETYREENKLGKGDFLLRDGLWQKSPRIVFFKPCELTVVPRWSVSTLARRHYGRNPHTINSFRGTFPEDPTLCRCFRKDCNHPATGVAVYNVWGSVYPIYTCDTCFREVNGYCGDLLPELKNPFLYLDGRPIIVE
jgi:hypothetical protein